MARNWIAILQLCALALLPGLAQAQSPDRGLELSYGERSRQACFGNCVSACTFAYFFPAEQPPRCMLTDDREPDLYVPRPRFMYSRRLGRQLTLHDMIEHFPRVVLRERHLLPPEVVAEVERRQGTPGVATADPAAGGMAACAGAALRSGRRWLVLYGHINNSEYFQHGNYLCSVAGDRFFVLGNPTLAYFGCGQGFAGCVARPGYDVHIGAALGPDTSGASERWPMTDGPNGSPTGTVVARF